SSAAFTENGCLLDPVGPYLTRAQGKKSRSSGCHRAAGRTQEKSTRFYDGAGVLRNASRASRLGMDGCAPGRVVESAPAALAMRIASSMFLPSPTATAKAP